MKILFPGLMVIILVGLVFMGVQEANLHLLFGITIPYVAISIFIIGVVTRVVKWSLSPVPFRIPTTCGQQKSLSWLKCDCLENPSTTAGVIGRMALEILTFRSLFRNTQTELKQGPYLVYQEEKLLWLAALAFHWSFLVVVIRHFRLFIEPIPGCLSLLCSLDGFMEIGSPVVFLSGVALLGAVSFLLLRRILSRKVYYISLPADYFPLFLIIGIAISGILMRYFTKVDVVNIKAYTLGLLSLQPVIPTDVSVIFYIHLFLVCVLLVYIPFSKLMHLGGIFLSPTRNMANNNRLKRHINPWNYPVKVHTYEEYEDEFREKMKKVGIPVEKG
ncbi:MAG: sulfate reduction electron transfer complex DsrMKJOP subunit DsrM [bacterium]|nr:sulfate reduction electron transfer complex DsrMKJOP subunit DsrM [bacterium]